MTAYPSRSIEISGRRFTLTPETFDRGDYLEAVVSEDGKPIRWPIDQQFASPVFALNCDALDELSDADHRRLVDELFAITEAGLRARFA